MTHIQVAAERDRAFFAWCELILAHEQLPRLTDTDLTTRFSGYWELPRDVRDAARTRLHAARDAARAKLWPLVAIRSHDNTPIMRGYLEQAGPPPAHFSQRNGLLCSATGAMTSEHPPRHIYTLERSATFVEDMTSRGTNGR